MAEATVAPEATEQQGAAAETATSAAKPSKAKKEKPPKAPKAPKEKKAKKEKKEKGSKRSRRTKGEQTEGKRRGFPKILLLIAFVLALLLAAFVFYYFNILGVRSTVLDAANRAVAYLDPEYRDSNELLAERENMLNEQENSFAARENDLKQREEALALSSADVDKRLAAVAAREKSFKEQQLASTPLYLKELPEEKIAELKKLGKIYSTMEPEAAAQAISLLNGVQAMVEVLFYMNEDAAAALLAVLEPEIAAQITAEMLRE